MIVRGPILPLSLFVALSLSAACGTSGSESPGGSGGAAGSAGAGGGGSCGDAGSGGDGGTGGTPAVVDVAGTLVDENWQPIEGARVALNGALDLAVTTGADGRFSFPGVSTPYDLAVEKGRLVYELRGLNRAAPTIPLASDWVAKRQATIEGSVTGTPLPLPGGDSLLLSLGPDTNAFEAEVDGSFQAAPRWYGAAKRSGDLAAVLVRVQFDGGLECLAAGARTDVSLDDGDTKGDLGVDLTQLADAPTQEAKIDIAYGAYTSFSSTRVAWFDVDGVRFRPRNAGWIPAKTTARFPANAGMAIVANDAKERAVWKVVPIGAETKVEFPAEAALRVIEPFANSTGVSRTPTLSWSAVPGARNYWVKVGNLSFVLPGTEHTLEIGTYEAWNAGLERGAGMSWEVMAFLDAGFSADDVTDGSGKGLDRRLLMDELTMYGSGLTFFQTAP